ncbi:MAG: hypothetical protein II882_10050 [Lachnospiraceae bacterium]|nr:hypothetical protein [Lachnospiraceae bacterium]
MMKKVLSLLLAALLAAALMGCGENGKESAAPGTQPEGSQKEQATDTPDTKAESPAEASSDAQPEDGLEILDKDGKRLGAISQRASCTAADEGIFYSVVDQAEYALTGTAQYRFFRLADGSDVLLGTLEDQGYEALYARTELDGVVYALAVTGNPFDNEPDTLWLLAFDTEKGSMEKYAVSEHGHPYAALTAVNGKLFIMNHEMTEPACDTVYVFDPAAGSVDELLSFADTAEASLRSICAAEDGFFLLRLRTADGQPQLSLDRYDSSGKKLSEKALNEMCLAALLKVQGIISEDDAKNELAMMVSHFSVEESRYLFYENFSVTRLILDLETGEALLAETDLYTMSPGGGSPVVYRINFPGDDFAGPEILALQDGAMTQLAFTAPDERTLIQSVSHSPAGTWLVYAKDAAGSAAALILWTEP